MTRNSRLKSEPSDKTRTLFWSVLIAHLGMTGLFFVFVFWRAIADMDDDPATLFQQSLTHIIASFAYVFAPALNVMNAHVPSWIKVASLPFLLGPGYSVLFAWTITTSVRLVSAVYKKRFPIVGPTVTAPVRMKDDAHE